MAARLSPFLLLLLCHCSAAHRETTSNAFSMAYHGGSKSVREAYDECFMPKDSREVTFQRVVNIVERRTTMSRPDVEFTRDSYPSDWYDNRYPDEEKGFHFQRNSPPPPQEDYAYYGGETRDDPQVRRQVEIRSRGRSPRYRGRKTRGRPGTPVRAHQGRGPQKHQAPFPYADRGQDKDGYQRRDSHHPSPRERSPSRRDTHAAIPALLPGFKGQGRSFSPGRENSYTYQQLQQRRKEKDDGRYWNSDRSRTSSNHTSSSPEDKTSHRSAVTQESCPASVVESPEVAPAASSEPSLEPLNDFKTRRAQTIASKAMEIEELYAQDCQTFGTVVKLLVDKKPSLEELLQGPLRDNLTELKRRCLDDLKHFIEELDRLNAAEADT